MNPCFCHLGMLSANDKNIKGTWCATYDDKHKVVLHWNGNFATRSVPLDPGTNVAIIRSASGMKRFMSYRNVLQDDEVESKMLCFNMNTVTDDEDSGDEEKHGNSSLAFDLEENGPLSWKKTSETYNKQNSVLPLASSRGSIYELVPQLALHHAKLPRNMSEDEDSLSPTATLLLLHYKLNHLPFEQLRVIAMSGYLPRKVLLRARIPKCAACLYGKAIRRAWRSKAPVNNVGSLFSTIPRQCVSVNQLQSPIPGLIAQLKGIPTIQQYTAAGSKRATEHHMFMTVATAVGQ